MGDAGARDAGALSQRHGSALVAPGDGAHAGQHDVRRTAGVLDQRVGSGAGVIQRSGSSSIRHVDALRTVSSAPGGTKYCTAGDGTSRHGRVSFAGQDHRDASPSDTPLQRSPVRHRSGPGGRAQRRFRGVERRRTCGMDHQQWRCARHGGLPGEPGPYGGHGPPRTGGGVRRQWLRPARGERRCQWTRLSRGLRVRAFPVLLQAAVEQYRGRGSLQCERAVHRCQRWPHSGGQPQPVPQREHRCMDLR